MTQIVARLFDISQVVANNVGHSSSHFFRSCCTSWFWVLVEFVGCNRVNEIGGSFTSYSSRLVSNHHLVIYSYSSFETNHVHDVTRYPKTGDFVSRVAKHNCVLDFDATR